MFKLNEKSYQFLKWTVILLLPATSCLYASLGKIWGFPYIDQITGTLMAVQVFLGTIFGISCATYSGDTPAPTIEPVPCVESIQEGPIEFVEEPIEEPVIEKHAKKDDVVSLETTAVQSKINSNINRA